MKKDNRDELEVIYMTFAEPLYYYLLKLSGSRDLAEELVQENHHHFISPYGLPQEELHKKEEKQEIDDLMNLLPEQYRTILHLREHQQFTYEELGTTLELTQNQVKVLLHRARQKLKQIADRKGFQQETINAQTERRYKND